MKKLTREEAISLHRKMWNWIADEMEKMGKFINKYSYFKAMKIPDCPDYLCYCCEYAIQQNNGELRSRCKHCPLDWESKYDLFMCSQIEELDDGEGLYERWEECENVKEGVKLARQIANLEER
ncbi:MAG: hypothetical protein ACLTBR_03120 [Anaerostipes sp.]|uniref:hypothetical protein n=1 Tax=Anaerostipes sp. TaxID=1872530 RepID=UPI0039923C66